MDAYLALNRLTLNDISQAAGESIDDPKYLASLELAKEQGLLFSEYHQGELVGYAQLQPRENKAWFVLMFVTHPNHRNRTVLLGLFKQILNHLNAHGGQQLISNVFKSNALSANFHRKLGFRVTRENHKGWEFTLDLTSDSVLSLKKAWLGD